MVFPRSHRRHRVPAPIRTRRLAPVVVLLVLAAAGTTLTVSRATRRASADDQPVGIPGAALANRTWMASIADSTNLARLSIPGTHDSLALCGQSSEDAEDVPPGDTIGCEPISTAITQTQANFGYSAQTLTVQLNSGIRSIDIRVRVNKDDHGLAFTIHHGVYYQHANFTDVLTKLRDFLAANPSEAVLLNLKAECTGETFSCTDADGFATNDWRTRIFDSYLQGRAYTGNNFDWNPSTSWGDLFWGPSVTGAGQAPTPTMGAIRGKVVVAGFRGTQGGILGGYGLAQLNNASAGGQNEYVQDDYDVSSLSAIADKWEKVRAHLRRTDGVWDLNRAGEKEYPYQPDALYLNGTNGSGGILGPADVAGGVGGATGVNKFLSQCLAGTDDRCPEFYPGRPANFGGRESMDRMGIMMMDFPGGDLLNAIISHNPFGADSMVNGGAGDPMEPLIGGDDGGPRPSGSGDGAASVKSVASAASADGTACRPDGLTPTPGVNTPYCLAYQSDGREWLGQGRTRRIVGYFNGGRTGADGMPWYLVKNIPWSKVTHLNYAFAHVENNRISVGAGGPANPATGMEWPGNPGAELDPSLPYKGHFNLLTKFKKLHPRVRTLISVGGWADSGGFYDMTTNTDGTVNQAGIDTFAASAVDFIRRYGFDGVDIDFEYPTSLDDSGNPADWGAANARRPGLQAGNTALMKSLREHLDRAAVADNHYYLLTSASSASGYVVRGMENQKGLRYEDFTNLMAYDYHGTWNDVVGPNAALYDDGHDPELADLYNTPEYRQIGYFNTDWAVHYLRGAVQAGRINIGVPYYTRGWQHVTGGTNGMWGSSTGSGCEPGTGIRRPCGDGALGIDNIWHDKSASGAELGSGVNPMWHAKNLEANVLPRYATHVGLTPGTDPADKVTGTYTRYWDGDTRTSWLWNPDKKTFLSTEDEQGIDSVIQYVNDSGAGGVMIWELAGDYACPAHVSAGDPCVMGYTMTQRMQDKLATTPAYGNSRNTGSSVTMPSAALDVSVDLVRYPSGTANLWPLTPTVRITNNSGVTIGGGTGNSISFDLPTSTPALIKDGNYQTGDQGGTWQVQAGHTGPNAGSGLHGWFHRVTAKLDYCQIIPAGQTLDLPIIYYLPATGPVNTTMTLGGRTYASLADNNRGAATASPPAGGCPAPAWDATKVYDPSTQPVEAVTVVDGGKVWRAKWWTRGNRPGTGADADHEPWKLVGPAG
jgi:GH18 family chitinase